MKNKKINCWEFSRCGREPGGDKVHELGICPAAIAKNCDGIHGGVCGGRACWAISGTLCEGKLQGTTAAKAKNCMRCAFYLKVMSEHNGDFLGADSIIALNNPDEIPAYHTHAGNDEAPFTALVLANDRTLAVTLGDFLGQQGFGVHKIATVAAAAKGAAQGTADVILLAVSQTDLHDTATASALRELIQGSNTPVIFLTDSSSRVVESQAFKLGAMGVIPTADTNFWDELDQKIKRITLLKQRMSGLSALLIDSDAASNRIISACLEQQGVTVLRAQDEAEAVDIIAQQPAIDLVISEGGGSAINGKELCRYLRNLPQFATTPILLLCPEESRHQVLDFFQAGATDYIIKPCPREELLARLLIHIEARQGLRELQREVKKNKLLLDSAGEGIIGIDTNGQVTFVNQAAARILGYLPDELLGKNLHGLTHHTSAAGEPYSPSDCPIQHSLESGAVITVNEDLFWRSDNTSLPVKFISTPIIGKGVITGAVVTFSDITAAKREEALRRDIDQITRHDLKTPLNGIIGIPGLLQEDGNLTDRQRNLLTMIHQSGYRMLQMINESLNVLQMEKGTYQFNPGPVDLLPVIRAILDELAAREERAIQVRITTKGNPCPDGQGFMVLGEQLLCYSMLSNLIKNAVEASPRGGTIHIALTPGEPLVEISIHNQGAVPKEIRERFFDKYATAGKPGGTGLGTYSAMIIATTHRGSLTMSSDEREGTTLTIKLPSLARDWSEGITPSPDAGEEHSPASTSQPPESAN